LYDDDAKQATSLIEKRRVDELDGKEYPSL
jgi:hypothetical protein